MIGTNLRIAFRGLWRNRFFSAINIIGFALGLAGFTLILLHVRFELSYDRFHQKADRLYLLTDNLNWGNGWSESWQTSSPMGLTLKEEVPEVVNACRLTPWFSQTMQVDDRKYVERIWFGDPAVFQMFSIPLLQGEAGRVLQAPNTITLSQNAAQKYFGESNPVGQSILWHNEFPLTVVGVFENLPPNSYLNFDYLISTETLRSPHLLGQSLDDWGPHNYYTYLELHSAKDVEAVTAEFPAFIGKHYGLDGWETYRPQLRALPTLHLQGDYRQIRMLVIIALFILAIAVVNYMNLSTSRSAKRAREVGVRKVMGGDACSVDPSVLF